MCQRDNPEYRYERKVRVLGTMMIAFVAFAPVLVSLAQGHVPALTALLVPGTYVWIFWFFGAARVFTGLALMFNGSGMGGATSDPEEDIGRWVRSHLAEKHQEIAVETQMTFRAQADRDMLAPRLHATVREFHGSADAIVLPQDLSDAILDRIVGKGTIYDHWFTAYAIENIETGFASAHDRMNADRAAREAVEAARSRRTYPLRAAPRWTAFLDRLSLKHGASRIP